MIEKHIPNIKMASDQERLYMQYFYNSVIEFMYFIILYIEGFGKMTLHTLCKHVKFFKVEVGVFMLSFHGETFEEKLYQMLNILGCFKLLNDNIYIDENYPSKDDIFKDLVISKCIDLILRGINDIDAICKNLNCNNIISVSKENIVDIIKKSSYFSIKNKQTVLLHHVHGLLGFEDSISNSVVCYFYDILYRDKVLSFNSVKNHSKFLSVCGIHNFIMIFSILNCSKQFDCKNGLICLKKKSKKYPKLKAIDIVLPEAKFFSRSLPVGQIVQNTYGSSIYKWSGEIGSLNESSGIIYCVVDFTNGYQGVFNICFNETALKVISETNNLKKYLNIRDAVEFDAKYYSGKNSERCWRASRLKLLQNNKLEYDEHLYDKLCSESELLKNQCANNRCCLSNINLSCDNFTYDNSRKAKSPKCNMEGKLVSKIVKISDNELYCMNNSVNKLEVICENDNKNHIPDQKPSCDLYLSFSNLFNVDYSFMFGHIFMLMADKGIAIAKHGKHFYNILFMKNSVCTPDKFENLINGQKVLVLIPYHGTLESFCVSTLVYGLNEQETYETEESNVLPKDFAMKLSAGIIAKKLQCKFCNNYNGLHQFISKDEDFATNVKQRMELLELYKFILREYKVPFQNDYLLQFLFGLYKINFGEENFNKKVFHFIVKLSKYFKHAIQKERAKCRRKLKMIKNPVNNYGLPIEIQVEDLCATVSAMSLTDKNSVSNSNLSPKAESLDDVSAMSLTDKNSVSNSNLSPKSKSLDAVAAEHSTGNLNSFDTWYSSDSNESFYSCHSNCNSPRHSPSLHSEKDCVITEDNDLPSKTNTEFKSGQVGQIQTKSNRKVSHLLSESNQDFSLKPQGKNLKQRLKYINQSKYLCLKSVSFLKHSVKKKKRIVFPPILRSVCRNCFSSSVSLAAYISMISKSFFFYSLNLNGSDVTLPLPKQVIPSELQGNMKLNSYNEITVIPNVLTNLSHIIAANVFT